MTSEARQDEHDVHQAEKKWYGRRRIALFLMLVSFCVSLALAELVLRQMNRFPSFPPYPAECIVQDPAICGLYQEFQPIGYRLWPSRTASYRYPPDSPHPLTLTANKHGFRGGRELDEPDSRFRILVLGDSFVFGEGVEEAERFTNVLEMLEPDWRVDNLGMTGFGPDLMLRTLEEIGLELNPDMVVFTLYTDDFRRVHPRFIGMGFDVPRFTLKSGQLISMPHPTPTIFDNLQLYRAMYQLRVRWMQWPLTQAILDRFLELSDQYAFQPIFVFLPGAADTETDKERRSWLSAFAEASQVPLLDLTDQIHETSGAAFIKDNPHYNATGHRIVATNLLQFLKDRMETTRPNSEIND